MKNHSSTGKYRIGTVARLTGLTPDVLRVWERRFEILDPERGPGGQRLYSEDDLVVLRAITRELGRGRSIGEVALAGREAYLTPEFEESTGPEPSEEGKPRLLSLTFKAIVQAAITLDDRKLEELLDEALRNSPPDQVIASVIEPAALEIGEAWARGICSVAGEHMASAVFTSRLGDLILEARRNVGAAPERLICCCLQDELHEIPALILQYHLTRAGFDVLYLGASLPLDDLDRAIREQEPDRVLISVSRQSVFEIHRSRLRELALRHREGVQIVLGGSGVPGVDPELESAGVTLWPGSRPARAWVNDLLESLNPGRSEVE